ncbi:hypothetical protein [Owenweeksia hongkongensis]|uniref:hypothetical protein n=1 Tax=Owenweeksia hongkongensis TaxID=253245 RepID=UPI003A94F114
MDDLSSWWFALDTLEKIYWGLAIPSSLMFLFQLITTFIGGAFDTDYTDPDLEIENDGGVGFQFFTFKNMVAFFVLFSWTGIASLDSGYSMLTTIIISVVSGLAMMTIMAFMFYQISKLHQSGTLKIERAVGKIGEAYLRIPGGRGGFGKIQLTLQGSVHEFDALTDQETDIPTGTIIQITEVIDQSIMLVITNSPKKQNP